MKALSKDNKEDKEFFAIAERMQKKALQLNKEKTGTIISKVQKPKNTPKLSDR